MKDKLEKFLANLILLPMIILLWIGSRIERACRRLRLLIARNK
jgi:hypothetical protein